MVEIGNIVTLENGMEFLLLAETFFEEKRYVYSMLTKENDQPTDEYAIFEVINSEDGEYLQIVLDEDLYAKLRSKFIEVLKESISD
jgi:aminopeptidase-like protein